MLTSYFRTVILLVFVILILRLMGTRQLGQLQPSELVVTILLSQVAATPMQDNDIPLLNTLVSMLVLAGMEILLSVLSMKSAHVRTLVDGSPVMIIRDGIVRQKEMRRLRYTVDDLLEALRAKNVFDLSDVDDAIVETNGSVSVLLKAEKRPAGTGLFRSNEAQTGIPDVLICDGVLRPKALAHAGVTQKRLEDYLQSENVAAEDVFLLTSDKTGALKLLRKGGEK